jgi:SAM-dependent methyltransferase
MDLLESQAVYNKLWTGTPAYRKASPERKTLQTRKVWLWDREEFQTVLCVGCGPAMGIRRLLSWGFDAHGVDFADAVKADFDEEGIGERFHHAEAHRMPFEDKSFDLVVCCDVLEHIPFPYVGPSCAEIHRVCKRRILLSVSTKPARFKGPAGEELHKTVRSFWWWMRYMEKIGGLRFVSGGEKGFIMELESP